MFALNLEYGISTVSCFAALALRRRVSMSAIGSVIVIWANALSRYGFRRPHASSRSVRAADLQRRCLPTGLRNAGQLAAVGLLTKADAAEAELAVDGVRTTADLATRIGAHLELRLSGRLVLKSGFCHISSP